MITYLEAKQRLEEIALANALENKIVGTDRAHRMIAASDIFSTEQVPPFDNSAMDGLAIFSEDTQAASVERPLRLPVRGFVAAGDERAYRQASTEGRGSAIEIMTGAPMPQGGHNAVIKIEEVKIERAPNGEAFAVEIKREVKAGENLRRKGTDFQLGQKVLATGSLIGPEQIFALSSVGISQLEVRRPVKIFIISTGSELAENAESKLAPGMIRNSSGPYLQAALQGPSLETTNLGIVKDDPHLYREKLELALGLGADIIISTGAVSVGKFDFVSDVLSAMKAKLYFHKVAIRPGKPILFGQLGARCAFFGLPGNPVSTAVGARFFLAPYLRALMGVGAEIPIQAELMEDCSLPKGLRCFYKARLLPRHGQLQVQLLKAQASYVVSSLLEANCWAVLPETEEEGLKAGSLVDLYSLQHHFKKEGLL